MRVHTVEIWRDGVLVGGEIGVSVGLCYTSYSGFRTTDSAGTVQCLALARFLQARGFKLWDLGMSLAYKHKFGAKNLPRLTFMAKLRAVRDETTPPLPTEPFACITLFPAATPGGAVAALPELGVCIPTKPMPQRNPDSKRQRKYRAKMERKAAFKAAKAAARAQQPAEAVQAGAVETGICAADSQQIAEI